MTCVYISMFAFVHFDSLHDSILMKPATDVARGQILFRDTFTQYGAFVTFIQAGAIKLFGEYLLILRLTAVVFYALTSVLLWHIWERFLSQRWTALALVLWITLAPFYVGPFHSWSSVYALVFQCGTLLSLLIFCEKKQYRALIFAGFGIALTFWSRQPVGVLLFLSTLGYIGVLGVFHMLFRKERIRAVLNVIFGCCVASLPFAIYLIVNRATHDWYLQSFLLMVPFTQVTRGISLDQLAKSLFIARYWNHLPAYIIWLIIPLSSVYLTGKACLRLRTKRLALASCESKLLAAGFVCLASWMQYYPVTEPAHFFWAVTPIVGFFLYSIEIQFHHFPEAVRRNLFSIAAFCIAALFVFRVLPGVIQIRTADTSYDRFPLFYGIRLAKSERDTIEHFYQTLTTYLPQGKTYINASDDPFIALVAPAQFHSIIPLYLHWGILDQIYRDYIPRVRQYIESTHPIIVTRYGPFFPNYCPITKPHYFDPNIRMYVWAGDLVHVNHTTDDTIAIRFSTEGMVKKVQAKTTNIDVDLMSSMMQSGIPLQFTEDSTIRIPFPKPLLYAIDEVAITFDSKDIKHCTFTYKIPKRDT